MGCLFLLLCMLSNLWKILDIVHFTFFHTGCFLISKTLLELCSELQLSYLKMVYFYSWCYNFQILPRQETIFFLYLDTLFWLLCPWHKTGFSEEKKKWYCYQLYNNETFENIRNINKVISDIILKLNDSKYKHQQFEF